MKKKLKVPNIQGKSCLDCGNRQSRPHLIVQGPCTTLQFYMKIKQMMQTVIERPNLRGSQVENGCIERYIVLYCPFSKIINSVTLRDLEMCKRNSEKTCVQ